MRGRLIKIERPKGYANIDEIYSLLDGVEKEEYCECGDFGEVLSKWATCDYGEVLGAISCCDVIKAVPLAKIKQAREEMDNLDRHFDNDCFSGNRDAMFKCNEVLAILDRLIAESEG